MANIKVSELLPVGYELFNDDASFLNELGNQEIGNVLGGHSYSHSYSRHYRHSHHSHPSHNSHHSHSQPSHSYSRRGWGNWWW